jgi:hypothetical protein
MPGGCSHMLWLENDELPDCYMLPFMVIRLLFNDLPGNFGSK